MALKTSGIRKSTPAKSGKDDVKELVAGVRKISREREKGYREQSLKIHPWVCARCGREFSAKNLHLLTVHHIDHNHDNNPPDGSNWENLCVYCHDNEHGRYEGEEFVSSVKDDDNVSLSQSPFANLADMLGKKNKK